MRIGRNVQATSAKASAQGGQPRHPYEDSIFDPQLHSADWAVSGGSLLRKNRPTRELAVPSVVPCLIGTPQAVQQTAYPLRVFPCPLWPSSPHELQPPRA